VPERPRAPAWPSLEGESWAFARARKARWHAARARHAQADRWHGKLDASGRPAYVAEACEEALDGGNYIAAELARRPRPQDPRQLHLAAAAFELAWLSLTGDSPRRGRVAEIARGLVAWASRQFRSQRSDA